MSVINGLAAPHVIARTHGRHTEYRLGFRCVFPYVS
jgi:hypothetical protein